MVLKCWSFILLGIYYTRKLADIQGNNEYDLFGVLYFFRSIIFSSSEASQSFNSVFFDVNVCIDCTFAVEDWALGKKGCIDRLYGITTLNVSLIETHL